MNETQILALKAQVEAILESNGLKGNVVGEQVTAAISEALGADVTPPAEVQPVEPVSLAPEAPTPPAEGENEAQSPQE